MVAISEGVCGIIMPMGAIEPIYSVDHWARVQKVIERAILDAGMDPQPVWENQNNDVIHGKILKNIYENEIIVCDCSGKSPNVMLELGMRLSTKKPAILICDRITSLPFDTSVIAHAFYPHDLEYNDTTRFIGELSSSIKAARAAAEEKTYISFVENFRFETVVPTSVTVSAEESNGKKIDALIASVSRLERELSNIRPSFGGDEPSGGVFDLRKESRISAATNFVHNALLGARVSHKKFGFGTVVEIDGNKFDVDFDEVGRKRTLGDFMTLESLAGVS